MRRIRAYTLAEILATVAIIGVILSVVVPLYVNMRNQAEEQRVMRDVFSLRDALRRCYQETGYFPGHLADLSSSTKPTGVWSAPNQCQNGVNGCGWSYISTPSDMPWNGPYFSSALHDVPGSLGPYNGYAWLGFTYDGGSTRLVWANSNYVMSNGQTYKSYTQSN